MFFNPMFVAWIAAANANTARMSAEAAQRAAANTARMSAEAAQRAASESATEAAALKALLALGSEEQKWVLCLHKNGYSTTEALREALLENRRRELYGRITAHLSSGEVLSARDDIEEDLALLRSLGRSPIESSKFDDVVERACARLAIKPMAETLSLIFSPSTSNQASPTPRGNERKRESNVVGPGKVTEVAADFSGKVLKVAWRPPSLGDVSGYRVHVKFTDDVTWTFDTVEPSGSFTLPTVIPDHVYVVSVEAKNQGALSGRGMGIFVRSSRSGKTSRNGGPRRPRS